MATNKADKLPTTSAKSRVKPVSVADLTRRIEALIRTCQFEGGETHPADEWLPILADRPKDLMSWLRTLESDDRYGVLPVALVLLGRIDPYELPADFRRQVISLGLSSKLDAVRDSAVQLIDLWFTPEALELLDAHVEPSKWVQMLIDGIQSVRQGAC